MKQKLFNLTLSTLFVAVLAACGSSKSEDMPKPKPDENTKPEMSQEEKDKISAEAKRKGYLATANKTQFQSLQAAKNTKSDLGTSPRTKTSNYYEGILNENTDVGTFNLNQDLDNIVVASPTKETKVGVYLEDFQFTQGVLAETTGLLAKAASEAVVETLIAAKFDALTSDKTFADEVKKEKDKSDETLKTAKDTFEASPKAASDKQTYDKAVITHKIEQAALDALAAEASTVEIKAAADAKAIADKVKEMKAVLAVAGGDLSAVAERTKGKQKIGDATKGIYFNNKVTATGGAVRATPVHTETNTVGKTADQEAFVYQTARKVYITADTEEEAEKLAKRVKEDAALDGGAVRVMKDSVAEVYGNKTFGVEHRASDSYAIINDNGVNAPFQKMVGKDKKGRDVYAADRLDYVQYGRVTSKLDEVTEDDLKEGIWANTKVGAYGKYGAEGTENHYFARGYNNVTSKDVLGKEGTVIYYGHAVTYGLDHNQNGRDANAIPNALGGRDAILSGTHVKATINLANDNVTGSLYNIWGDDNATRKVDLVKFEGVIGANGNMAGESHLAYMPESKGSFLAALYGAKGEEMAGKVQSNDRSADKGWVGVFGAKKAVEKAADNTGSPFVPSNQAGSNAGAAAGTGAGTAQP